MRSLCPIVLPRSSIAQIYEGGVLTALSEYHPQIRALAIQIAPPGVERISVCFTLDMVHLQVKPHTACVYIPHSRIPESLDDQIAN